MAENNREILQNDEMRLDVFCILRALLKDWWMILTAGLVGAMCAYMVAEITYTPVYVSKMTFIVSSKGATSSLSNTSAANAMAETFGEVLNSNLLKKKVQQELNLSYLPGDVTTSVVDGTNLMSLKVSASSPEDAFRIINSILDHYSEITDYVLNNVVLDILEAPEVPKSPSNPTSTRDVMKKYGVIAMGIMAVLLGLLDYLKDDIKNEKQVEKKLDTKLFATVYHEIKNRTLRGKIRNTKKALLVTDPINSFLFVETYKKIRTKLMYKAEPNQSKVILVTSVKENEGKSTVAANIALTLAQENKKVVLVDGDMRRPAIHKIFRRTLTTDQEIGEYLNGNVPLKRILQWDEESGLYLMIGSRHYVKSTEMVSGSTMASLIKAVKSIADYVVIDSPPTSLMADAEILAENADMSLLVVRQSMSCARDINDTIDMLENSNSELLGCIYNNVKTGIFSGKKVWGDYRYGGYKNYKAYYGNYGYGKSAKRDRNPERFLADIEEQE